MLRPSENWQERTKSQQPLLLPRRGDRRGLLEPEFQERFAGHFDLLASSEHLHRSSRSCADARANSCALPAAGNGTDNGSQSGATADFLGGVLAASLPFQRVVTAHNGIVIPINHDASPFKLQLLTALDVAPFLCLRK